LIIFSVSSKNSGLLLILAHGYTSTLIFYLIGEFYHSFNTRIVYFFNRFFSSNIFFSVLFAVVFLSNIGVPPSASFISEFIIISNSIILSTFFFYFIFIYFVVAFYYSLFLIACSFVGKSIINFEVFNRNLSYFISFIIFNVFWLSLL
jgi:NADH:ubiquinone oxidoreductase subunit 4 (subunit M)